MKPDSCTSELGLLDRSSLIPSLGSAFLTVTLSFYYRCCRRPGGRGVERAQRCSLSDWCSPCHRSPDMARSEMEKPLGREGSCSGGSLPVGGGLRSASRNILVWGEGYEMTLVIFYPQLFPPLWSLSVPLWNGA